jgi:O-succinylbenzoic acid--CoA ligase
MQVALDYLEKRAPDDWLIGYDSRRFNQIVAELYLELTQLLSCGSPKFF